MRAWGVVEASFAPHRPPGTLLGVAVLGYPKQLVEVEAVALGSSRGALDQLDAVTRLKGETW